MNVELFNFFFVAGKIARHKDKLSKLQKIAKKNHHTIAILKTKENSLKSSISLPQHQARARSTFVNVLSN